VAGWFDAAWAKRIPIAVVVPSAVVSADVSFVLPSDWDDFWDDADLGAAGESIRVVAPDGVTLLSYQFSGFSVANRTCTLEIDNVQLEVYSGVSGGAAGNALVWLYWSNASAVDAQSTFTAATPLTAAIYLGQGSGLSYDAVRPVPGATAPVDEFAKTTAETIRIWVRVKDLTDARATSYAGSLGLDGVSYVGQDVQTGGVSQATMFLAYDALFAEPEPGDLRVGVRVKAGTDATDYTITPTITTFLLTSAGSLTDVYNPRAILRVNDISEA